MSQGNKFAVKLIKEVNQYYDKSIYGKKMNPDASDKILVESAVAGDKKSLELLVKRHQALDLQYSS